MVRKKLIETGVRIFIGTVVLEDKNSFFFF